MIPFTEINKRYQRKIVLHLFSKDMLKLKNTILVFITIISWFRFRFQNIPSELKKFNRIFFSNNLNNINRLNFMLEISKNEHEHDSKNRT